MIIYRRRPWSNDGSGKVMVNICGFSRLPLVLPGEEMTLAHDGWKAEEKWKKACRFTWA
jgi:hypothetical protein